MTRRQARHAKFDAARVRELRAASALTNEQLAAKVGVTLRTVQRWQDGTSAPQGLPELMALALALEVDAAELYAERVPAA